MCVKIEVLKLRIVRYDTKGVVTVGKEYGYSRISTAKQSIDRQIRNIKAKYPKAIIVQEVYTGTKFQGRKELDNLLKKIRRDDTIIFDSVSRMSRNADEGCELYEKLFNQGINLAFLKEPHINTEVYRAAIQKQIEIRLETGNQATDKLLNTILDALNEYAIDLAKQQIRLAFEQSEKEVADLHQRTKEGIETARLKGKQIGGVTGKKLTTKKSVIAKEKIKKHNKDFGGSLNNEDTWNLIGISKMTFYKYKKELQEEMRKGM